MLHHHPDAGPAGMFQGRLLTPLAVVKTLIAAGTQLPLQTLRGRFSATSICLVSVENLTKVVQKLLGSAR